MGTLHEQQAINDTWTGTVVTKSGILLHSSDCFGASHNDLINTDVVIEVKRSDVCRDTDITNHLGDKHFFLSHNCESDEINLNLKNDQGNKYYHQVQCNLRLTKKSVCHFVVWCPIKMIVLILPVDSLYEAKHINTLKSFYTNYFLPALLGLDS